MKKSKGGPGSGRRPSGLPGGVANSSPNSDRMVIGRGDKPRVVGPSKPTRAGQRFADLFPHGRTENDIKPAK